MNSIFLKGIKSKKIRESRKVKNDPQQFFGWTGWLRLNLGQSHFFFDRKQLLKKNPTRQAKKIKVIRLILIVQR